MRLIDAYMLLQAMDNKYADLIEEHKNTPDIAEAFILIDELIKNQPTAYDLEAVVKQIADYRELIPAWALKEIIEIVRNGGVKHG